MIETAPTVLWPHPGPQLKFHQSPAFELLYGGAAGGGKTWSLLAEGLRQVDNADYTGVLFRRTFPQLNQAKGPIDKSRTMFRSYGTYVDSRKVWAFPSGAKFFFSHMAEKDSHLDHDGAAYAYAAFDELAHFFEEQYRYIFSRMRVEAASGLRTYIRAATNPPGKKHPGRGWIKRRWAPWLDKSHPNPAKSGELRWYAIVDGEEIEVEPGHPEAWSRSFIQAFYTDNPSLDKSYARNLDSLPKEERRRLKLGDWSSDEQKGSIFDKRWFRILEPGSMPQTAERFRFWDLAATKQKTSGDDPDYTATTLMVQKDGVTYFETMRDRLTPAEAKRWMRELAAREPETVIGWEQEPGSAGVYVRDDLLEMFRQMGRVAKPRRPQGDKVQRASLWSPQAELGKVVLVRNNHTPIEAVLNELYEFPNSGPEIHDDMIDSMSGAWLMTVSRDEAVDGDGWGY